MNAKEVLIKWIETGEFQRVFKWLLGLIMLFAFGIGQTTAQTLKCGSQMVPPPNGNNPDSLILDRFGNVYDLEDLLIPPPAANPNGGCQSGYFNLTFDVNFPMDKQPTVCKVFADLSAIIVQHNNTLGCGDAIPASNVDIDIIWEDLTPVDVLGIGTPFYSGPEDAFCDEMLLDRPFIKINGGIVNPFATEIFDGRLRINAHPAKLMPNLPPLPLTWQIGPALPGPTEVDLYSVTLHEALHILGFASRVGLGNAYSLWDRILNLTDNFVPNGGSQNLVPILTNSPAHLPCTTSSNNCWDFKAPEVNSGNINTLVVNTCSTAPGTPDIVVGATGIAPIDWANGGANSAALSHLSETCNGNPSEVYVMRGGFDPGMARRDISQGELQILCEIGYQTTSPNCNACYNIANQDRYHIEDAVCCFKTYYACAGQTIKVLNAELLCNDVTNGNTQEVTRVWDSNPNFPTVNPVPNAAGTGWDILIPANYNSSTANLSYTSTGCDCRQHNARFDIVVDRQCPPCTFTPDPCDNLLCAGDFENFTNTQSIVSHFEWPIIFEGDEVSGTPDVQVTNTANHYLRLGDFTPNREAVTLKLQKCIEPGCNLTLSMDLSGSQNNGFLEVWGSIGRPCDATKLGAVPISNNCGQATQCDPANTFDPVCIFDIDVVNTYMGNDNPNFASVSPPPWQNQTNDNVCYLTLVPFGGGSGIYLDNITATLTCEPEITCNDPASQNVCPGEIAEIAFQVCAPDIPECLDLALVTPTVALPSGWTLVSGSPGPFTLTEDNCEVITLQVQIPSNAPIGSMEMVVLSGTATGLCTTVEWDCSANVTVIDCSAPQGFTCPCGEGGLNIDASSASIYYDASLGGVPYAVLEAVFNYDQDDNGLIEGKEHNNCIAILGNLIVDQNLSILTCENVKMQPCSKITVGTSAAHSTLDLTQNTIYSCDTMWHGITVTPYAALNFTKNQIRDAQFAVTAQGSVAQPGIAPTKLNAKNNLFLNNHIGVFFPDNASRIVAHIPFEGNSFKSDVDLKPPCDANLPNYSSTLRGYAGVVTLGTSLTIGTPGSNGYANTFGGIRNGIIGEKCILIVNRADIQDLIAGTDVYPPSFAGAIGNGVIAIEGKAAVVNSKFVHVPRGVFGRANKNLTVSNNRMTFMIRGVETLAVGHSVISDNPTIGFADRGILCREVIPGGGLGGAAHSIERNTHMFITPNPSGPQYFSAAIEIDNALSTDVGVASISNNHFSNHGFFAHGIRINGSGGWDIAENGIDFQAPASPAAYTNVGIQLTNTHENYLYHDTINDIDPYFNESTALSLTNGTGNRYCCNVTHGSRFGSRFLGACGSTEWRVTDMLDHEFALFCEAGTQISQQFDYGNDFNTTSGAAFHGGDDQEVANSRFRVLNMQQPYWPESIATPNATVDFFIQPGTDASCTAPCIAPEYAPQPPDRDIDESDLTIVTGDYSSGQYGAALQWESGRRLYERMRDYEGLLGDHSATDAFYYASSTGTLGAYYDAEHKAKGIYDYPTGIRSDLQQFLAQLESIQLAVETILAGLASATNYADSMAIYQDANLLYASAQTAAGNLKDAEALAKLFQNTEATSALSLTNALSTENLLEQNRKAVQRLYLQTLGLGIHRLTASQLLIAESIAIQCPLEGGSAVYAARALYRLNADRAFNDDSLCFGVHERRQVQTKPVEHSEIYLLPNPATDMVTVAGLSASAENPALIQLADANGVLRMEHKVAEREWAFSVTSLPSGIYFCRAQLGDAKPVVLKLVVSH